MKVETSLRVAVTYCDVAHNVSAKRRFENEINLQNIEKGYVGTMQSNVADGEKSVKKETTIC